MSKRTFNFLFLTIIITMIALLVTLERLDSERLYYIKCEQPLKNVEEKDNLEEAIEHLQITNEYLDLKMLKQDKRVIYKEGERRQFEKFYNTIKSTKENLEYSKKNESKLEQYRALMRAKITIGKCNIPQGIELYPNVIVFRVVEIFIYISTMSLWILLLWSASKDTKLNEEQY